MSTMDYRGHRFTVEVEPDDSMQEPWKEHDGHGPVSEWTSRNKAPGERVLISDRGRRHLFYDYAAAVRIARKDGWGDARKLASALGREPSSGELAAWAADEDFKYLRAWCRDEWRWVGVIVKLGKHSESLWGIDGDHGDYLMEVARELADQILHAVAAEQAAIMDRPTFAEARHAD